jgi:hypothetical protein
MDKANHAYPIKNSAVINPYRPIASKKTNTIHILIKHGRDAIPAGVVPFNNSGYGS